MGKYIGIRLAHAVVILAIVLVLVFVIARLIPGRILTGEGDTIRPRSTIRKFAVGVSVTLPSRSKSRAAASGSISWASLSAR